jgi:hypothetical protein
VNLLGMEIGDNGAGAFLIIFEDTPETYRHESQCMKAT